MFFVRRERETEREREREGERRRERGQEQIQFAAAPDELCYTNISSQSMTLESLIKKSTPLFSQSAVA